MVSPTGSYKISGLVSPSKSAATLIVLAAIVAVVALILPPFPQSLSYHHFADQRSWLGIANFGDVASNLPFAAIGIWGLLFLYSKAGSQEGQEGWSRASSPAFAMAHTARASALGSTAERFALTPEQIPYLGVFAGLILTAFGSAYYHLAPDNTRLVWDRLPMTIVFMSLVAAVIAERISVRAGLWSLPVLLAIGAGSVVQWHLSELHGHGDLRFYAAVQVYAALVLLLALWLPPKYTRGSDLAVVVGFYVVAKILEIADGKIFAIGNIVSGHTLKHMAGAMAGYWILRMLQKRRLISHPQQSM